MSELYTKRYKLKFDFEDKELLKAISLLLMLKERRSKSFPQILGIIEQIILQKVGKRKILTNINSILKELIEEKFKKIEDNQYDLMWLIYFVKSHDLFKPVFPKKFKSELIKSLKNNTTEFFKPIPTGIKLFDTIKKAGKNVTLLEHLALFKKNEE